MAGAADVVEFAIALEDLLPRCKIVDREDCYVMMISEVRNSVLFVLEFQSSDMICRAADD